MERGLRIEECSQSKPKKIVDGNDFYFAHSFFCDVDDKYCVAYILRSDKRIPVLISDQKNIFGIQFHPEISGLNGANLFARIVKAPLEYPEQVTTNEKFFPLWSSGKS